jgi:UDP-3-O-[3-hydroxymyristoyl] glucosamine N-acyltransferase
VTQNGDALPGDPRFFARTGPHSLATVAATAEAEASATGPLMLSGVAPLGRAGPDDVSYIDSRRHAAALVETRAGAVLVRRDLADRVPPGSIALVCAEPGLAWVRVAALFHPAPPVHPDVHPSAVVDPTAHVDPSAEVGPLAVIGARAEIGPRCRIGAGAVIGEAVVIGADCRIGAATSISHALLGARVVLAPGARIGQEGFGLVSAADGVRTLPQLGRVVVGDDVEVGANTTIDRGALTDTVIGAGSHLDNLVQIGHNVRLGRCCVIVAQVGISGSTILEDFVTVGGQAAAASHLRIGRGARIGAQSGVMADLAAGAEVVGSPAMPARAFFRQVALLRRLTRKGSNGKPDGAKPDDEGTG